MLITSSNRSAEISCYSKFICRTWNIALMNDEQISVVHRCTVVHTNNRVGDIPLIIPFPDISCIHPNPECPSSFPAIFSPLLPNPDPINTTNPRTNPRKGIPCPEITWLPAKFPIIVIIINTMTPPWFSMLFCQHLTSYFIQTAWEQHCTPDVELCNSGWNVLHKICMHVLWNHSVGF